MDDEARKATPRAMPIGKPRFRRADPDQVLAAAFGSPMPASESAMWAAMSLEQRTSAIKRLRMMVALDDPAKAPAMGLANGSLEKAAAMSEAAAAAGVSLNRWYEMHAAWKQNRSLASLGTFAAVPRTRVLSYHNDLRELAVEVIDADTTASVRKLALALGEAYGRKTGLSEDKWPSHNTLRKFAEAELRRRARKDEAGSDVRFDCCACELPHSEATFVAFFIIDNATRMVLGAALGDPDNSKTGYASAARDALKRIRTKPLDALPWADRTNNSELVVGRDIGSWADHSEDMRRAGLPGQLQLATAGRRFGAHVRRYLGERLGRVKFMPGRTKDVVFAQPRPEDLQRLLVEVEFHNAELVEAFEAEHRREPPSALIALLRTLARR
jgi:hypothetical protein